MKVELTKKQYEKLIRLIYLGNRVINSFRLPDEQIEEYEELEQYLLSFAKEAGLGKYIVFDEESKEFFPTREFEEDPELNQYLEEYDAQIFWDELIHRLAWRDLVRVYGTAEIQKMTPRERFEKKLKFVEKYSKEFEKHGIEYLRL